MGVVGLGTSASRAAAIDLETITVQPPPPRFCLVSRIGG
jgi:hypothetical protein